MCHAGYKKSFKFMILQALFYVTTHWFCYCSILSISPLFYVTNIKFISMLSHVISLPTMDVVFQTFSVQNRERQTVIGNCPIFLYQYFIGRYNLPSDVRLALYEEAEKWMRAVGRRKFLGGRAPNLADLVGNNLSAILNFI